MCQSSPSEAFIFIELRGKEVLSLQRCWLVLVMVALQTFERKGKD
jgi:hypothetical protein